MPCPLPRWTGQVLDGYRVARSRAGFFPVRTAFPAIGPGRRPHCTFEACSSFTRVTACRVARPPYVDFFARLRPGRFPGSALASYRTSTINLFEWVLPPLVISPVRAHTISLHTRPRSHPEEFPPASLRIGTFPVNLARRRKFRIRRFTTRMTDGHWSDGAALRGERS